MRLEQLIPKSENDDAIAVSEHSRQVRRRRQDVREIALGAMQLDGA